MIWAKPKLIDKILIPLTNEQIMLLNCWYFYISDFLGIISKSIVSWKFSVMWSDLWKRHCIKRIFWESEQFFTYKTSCKKRHLMCYKENDIRRKMIHVSCPMTCTSVLHLVWLLKRSVLDWLPCTLRVCLPVHRQTWSHVPFCPLYLSLHEFPAIIMISFIT